MEDAGDGLQHFLGLARAGDLVIESVPGFLAAETIGHQFVADLGDTVQIPLVAQVMPVQICLRQILGHAVTVVDDHVVKDPGGVVGPGKLEHPVPDAGVAAGFRIVVARHLHLQPLYVIDAGRHAAAEALGAGFKGDHGGVGVGEAVTDDFRIARQVKIVHQGAAGTVGAGLVDCRQPRGFPFEAERHVPQILAGSLAFQRAAVIGDRFVVRVGDDDAIPYGRGHDVAGMVLIRQLFVQPLHAQSDPQPSVQLVGDAEAVTATVGALALGVQVGDLGADADFRFRSRSVGQGRLIRSADPHLPRYSGQRQRASGRAQGSFVQIDTFIPVHKADDRSLADHVQQRGVLDRLKAVGLFHGSAVTAAPAFALASGNDVRFPPQLLSPPSLPSLPPPPPPLDAVTSADALFQFFEVKLPLRANTETV